MLMMSLEENASKQMTFVRSQTNHLRVYVRSNVFSSSLRIPMVVDKQYVAVESRSILQYRSRAATASNSRASSCHAPPAFVSRNNPHRCLLKRWSVHTRCILLCSCALGEIMICGVRLIRFGMGSKPPQPTTPHRRKLENM